MAGRPLFLALSLVGSLIPGLSAAQPADPFSTSVDLVLIVCPEGDVVFRVVPRDFAGHPISGMDIQLAFASCPTFPACPDAPGSPLPYVLDRTKRTITVVANAQGIADFAIRMGGTCPDSLVTVYADGGGEFLRQRSVVSPDQDGNGTVDATDLAILQSKLGRRDATGDFDGDGIVTSADVALLQAHLGHSCELATPTVPMSWGRLKLLYR